MKNIKTKSKQKNRKKLNETTILGILLMNSCNTIIFLATNIICSLSTLNLQTKT